MTNIGKDREQNEDAFTFCPNLSDPYWGHTEACSDFGDLGSVLAVADGMGGANAGEVASACALEVIQEQFTRTNVTSALQSDKQINEFLIKTISLANNAIVNLMVQSPETYGMGTTIVICWLLKDKAHIAWCGDSRCYIYNNNSGLKALTKDHSLVQELIDKGDITEEEAFYHPDNNLITRGLGDFDTKAIPEITTYTLIPNDIVLLCSDGICGYCNNKTLEQTIKSSQTDLKDCGHQLLEVALKSGSEDDITITLATVMDD